MEAASESCCVTVLTYCICSPSLVVKDLSLHRRSNCNEKGCDSCYSSSSSSLCKPQDNCDETPGLLSWHGGPSRSSHLALSRITAFLSGSYAKVEILSLPCMLIPVIRALGKWAQVSSAALFTCE